MSKNPWKWKKWTLNWKARITLSAVASGSGTPGIWGFRKGSKPDFCLSEVSYYIPGTPLDLKSYLRRRVSYYVHICMYRYAKKMYAKISGTRRKNLNTFNACSMRIKSPKFWKNINLSTNIESMRLICSNFIKMSSPYFPTSAAVAAVRKVYQTKTVLKICRTKFQQNFPQELYQSHGWIIH